MGNDLNFHKNLPLTEADSWHHWVFFLFSCCHSPVYSHYISWRPPWDCIIKLTGSITVLLQPWLTLYIPWKSVCIDCFCDTLQNALGFYCLLLQCKTALSKQWPIKFWEDPSCKWDFRKKKEKSFVNVSIWLYNSHTVMLSAYHRMFGWRAIKSKFANVHPNNTLVALKEMMRIVMIHINKILHMRKQRYFWF